MNFIDPSPAFIAWLGDALMQCSVLLALTLLAERCAQRVPAAWRHSALLAAAIGVPVLFTLSAVLPAWKVPHSETFSAPFASKVNAVQSSVSYELGAPVTAATDRPALTAPTLGQQQATTTAPRRQAKLLPWLLGAWLAVTVALWLRMALGILALSRQRTTEDHGFASIVAEEARRLKLTQPPKLVLLAAGTMPMTWRLRHHMLALPETASEWSENKLRRVLRHELAHIQRNDCRTAWLADASLAILWFHPLVWLHRRALGRARETACDDLAVGADAIDETLNSYAQDLLEVVSNHSRKNRNGGLALALAMANKRSGIRRRLESILDPTRDRRPVPRRARRWTMPLWAIGLGTLASLAACRDSTENADTTNADGVLTRAYTLVEAQQRFLRLFNENDDPFGAGGNVWVKPEHVDGAIRSALHNYGVLIPPEAPVEFLLDGFENLTVKADAVTQAQIKMALNAMTNSRQISVKVSTFEVADHALIQQLVGNHSLKSSTGSGDANQINTGILSLEQAEAMASKLGATPGVEKRDPTSMTTRFHQRAKFEQIREFIYPTEYDPPEIPKDAPKNDAGTLFGSFPVTPANPTAFEMRPIGLTWEIEATPLPGDGIGLTYGLNRVQFLGFINYGSPIQCMDKNFFGKPVSVMLTENRIEQPIFRSDRLHSTADIPSGHALILVTPGAPSDPNVEQAISSPGESALPTPGLRNGADLDLAKGMIYILHPSIVE